MLYRALDARPRVALVLRGLGSVAIDNRDPFGAVELHEEGLIHARATRQDWETTAATNLLGTAAFALGDYGTALRHHEGALALWRQLRDTGYVLAAMTNIGLVAFDSGDIARAEQSFREALERAAATGDRLSRVYTVDGFGLLATAPAFEKPSETKRSLRLGALVRRSRWRTPQPKQARCN